MYMIVGDLVVNFKNASWLTIKKTIGAFDINVAFGYRRINIVLDDENIVKILKGISDDQKRQLALQLFMWMSSGDAVITKRDIYDRILEIYQNL